MAQCATGRGLQDRRSRGNALLGKTVTRGRWWRPAGFAIHSANGAVFGLAFEELRRRSSRPAWQVGIGLALAEHVGLYPLSALVDRYHPARGEEGVPPLLHNPRLRAGDAAARRLRPLLARLA